MRLLLRPTCLTRRIPLWSLPRAAPHGAVHHTSTTNVVPVELPKLLVKPGSVNHNSLESYLAYAKRINLSSDRTVYIGTHYEYIAADALVRLGFSLTRTGQKNDAGIDLIGHWVLSFLREPVPVIVQCKSRLKTCSPHEIRELEGAFQSVPPEWRNKDVLGLLVSNQKATEGLRKQMYLSRRPMAFLQISKTGTITQFVWNRAATERGLEGLGVTPRYVVLPPEIVEDEKGEVYRCEDRPRDANGRFIRDPYSKLRKQGTSRTVVADIQLTWMGTPIAPSKEQIAQDTAKHVAAITEKRKRGRPRGSKTKVKTDAAKEVNTHWSPSDARMDVNGRATAQSKIPRGKRGRPRKELKDEFGDPGSGEIVPKIVPPKRGRPRKNPIASVD